MPPFFEHNLAQTRRQFVGSTGGRLGAAALAGVLANSGSVSAADSTGAKVHPALPGFPHFPPKAKSVIYLHMNGGPAQMDLWDYKPGLNEYFDKDLPDSVRQNQRITTMTSGQKRLPVAPSKFKFTQHGQCGRWVSELLPHTAQHVDKIALVKTVHTNAINDDPACTFVMTGSEVPGKPSLGSWVSYGLGAETNNLPSFVVLTPTWSAKAAAQALFTRMWSSGFLATSYSGVALRSVGDPVLYIQNPPGVESRDRRAMLDVLSKLNQRQFQELGDPEIQTRISQYEMAFRMQGSVPELVDLKGETKETLEAYGPDVNTPGTFAASALLARRLVERGVDQPCGALLNDLKQLGLLDSTLVVWGGEFGRTVYSQGQLTKETYGRDHHPRNFCMWMAGGGIKGGISFGETDDFSYNVVENPANVNDLNATILHCLGIDHERFTYKFQGLEQRLTGVEGPKIIPELLA
ncbi:MAG: DUF1501 domain-containing protein [Planctomycetota bacterium]|nr:DUF1501 domain-containing protein [Planctomycetota bacterium]